ncbi:MAG: hypothetical protein GT598_10715 [Bacteroidales bacterium]|nr:hypothetical protein [Bacteroidales bacterium]HPM18175.1 hypothetical protein [Bacteroidales bacterium]HQG76282.1 hypothetical protein [Bacteroidales bacterium]
MNSLREIESKLLLYFSIVRDGCRNYVSECEYTPYNCGYSEGSERPVNTYELCMFVTGVVKCPGEIEKHYRERHNKRVCRTILRAIERLEKKGFIIKDNRSAGVISQTDKWHMTYRMV